MPLPYAIYDVFSDTPLAGNPLAVVFDAEALDTAQMQAIAAEFNLSETVFVLPPEETAVTASLRIFTPKGELPFAGHPTVGAAVAITEREGGSETMDRLLVLSEKIGHIRAAVHRSGQAVHAEFDLARLPEVLPCDLTKEEVAAALGLDATDIGFENHVISGWSAGNPLICVPVRGLEQAGRARFNLPLWLSLFGGDDAKECPFVYCRETVNHDAAFHARMFAPHHGIPEDPATGSAVAAFAGAIHRFDELAEGPSEFIVEQGMEMGRPSRIRLEIDGREGAIHAARIGGAAVRVAEGQLHL